MQKKSDENSRANNVQEEHQRLHREVNPIYRVKQVWAEGALDQPKIERETQANDRREQRAGTRRGQSPRKRGACAR